MVTIAIANAEGRNVIDNNQNKVSHNSSLSYMHVGCISVMLAMFADAIIKIAVSSSMT
jgi:hypothetical protein